MWLMGVNISINYASVCFFPLGCYIRQSRVFPFFLNHVSLTLTRTCPNIYCVDLRCLLGLGGGNYLVLLAVDGYRLDST